MGKYLSVFTIIICLFFSVAFGEESILSLIKKYEEESVLSKKTKEESLGHLIVFTRQDIENMQAYTLADILRLVPISNFLPNKYGIETLANPGRPLTVPFIYRLYIDDHEVSSIHTYSPFLIYDRYPLDHINHIEIYFSPGAISVSNEPSQMIIRMYTKRPSRENSTKVRGTVGSKKSYTLSFFDARILNDRSCMLISFSKSYFKFPDLTINNQTLNRNQFRKNLFLKYRYLNTTVEFSAVDVKRGGFTGNSADKSPDFSNVYSLDSYFSIRHDFDDNTKVVFSYDYQKRKYKEKNKSSEGGIYIPAIYNFLNPPTYYYEDLNFHKFAVSLDKKLKTDKNTLLLGTFLRYYMQDVSKNEYANSSGLYSLENAFRVKNFYIGSFYAENSYNIDEKKLFIAGLKYDKFKFYGQKSKDRINVRLGFIAFANHSIMLKSFLSHYYVLPSMLLIEFSKNKKLNSMKSTVFSSEIKYIFGKNEIRLFYSYYNVQDIISFDRASGYYVNTNKSGNFREYGFFFKRKINQFTNFELNYWITEVGKDKYSPERGGYLRFVQEFGKLNIYSDVLYKGSYKPYGTKINETFNLRVSAGYKLPADFYLKITGENLLNNSEKVIYRDIFGNSHIYSSNYRRILLTVEKIF